jgi:hypothetical protein
MKNNYLIVGSGFGVDKWWYKNKEYILKNKYRIIPINNAWKLVGVENIYIWMVPSDYYCRGTFAITDKEIESINAINIFSPNPEKAEALRSGSKAKVNTPQPICENYPKDLQYFYKPKSGTMFVNTMLSLFRRFYEQRHESFFYIIGSDFDYSKKNSTHWYSNIKGNKAAKDPLRHGKDWLKQELAHLKLMSDKYEYKVYNYSTNINTLLSFKQVVLQ